MLQPTLKSSCVSVKSLSDNDIEKMYRIYESNYSFVNFEEFQTDLIKKNAVIIVRTLVSGDIVGFSTIMDLELQYNGEKINGLFSGDTILEKQYWGSTALHKEFLQYVIKKKLKHPTRKYYWFLISKGYKTYLLMANNFINYYPRFDKATPEKESQIIAAFSKTLYPKYYNHEKGLIEFPYESARLKNGVAPISDQDLQHPKISFFQTKNPEWESGTELPCIGEMSFAQFGRSFLKTVYKIAKSQIPGTKRPTKAPQGQKA